VNFQYQQQSYSINRHPLEENQSLQAWSAADEHLLQHLEGVSLENKEVVILNDRFGFLTCLTHSHHPTSIQTSKSEEKATQQNLLNNQLDVTGVSFFTPLSLSEKAFDVGFLKIPKSLELFRLYLQTLAQNWKEDAVLFCGFMTRHFSPQILTIAAEFFEEVEQSRAWKKSRVLILKSPKALKERALIHQISFEGQVFQQYFGVFSAKHIDYASQFLVENLTLNPNDQRVLDLASGNGVLAAIARKQNPNCELHLLDDSYLAIESSKLNLAAANTFFHCDNTLTDFETDYFDCVISNPPFHFEHEINIQTSLQLFKEVQRCLSPKGCFILVANKHLNYKTHLQLLFSTINIVNENSKFIIYECCDKIIAL
jgi:16S rRNA G1207 methylase RsmC